jgi:hypothetical protein
MASGEWTIPFNGFGTSVKYMEQKDGTAQVHAEYLDDEGEEVIVWATEPDAGTAKATAKALAEAIRDSMKNREIPRNRRLRKPEDEVRRAAAAATIEAWFAPRGGVRIRLGQRVAVVPETK